VITPKLFAKRHYVAISRLILATFFVFIILSLNKNFNKYLDSDMSSELVLAKQLHDEHKILTTEWYYSTELRVLNTQLVFSPLFGIFNNWHTIRIVGTTLLLLLLLASFLIFCKKMQIKYKYILALYIVGAYSIEYYSFVVAGTYYIPHIAISFLTLALLANIFKKNKIVITNILLITLSFIAGLGGIRQLVILYLPLCVTSTLYLLYSQWNTIKTFHVDVKFNSFLVFISTLFMGIASFIGYIINISVLQKYFTFFNYANTTFEFSSLRRLSKIFLGVLYTHGLPYYNSTSLSIVAKIVMTICFIIWATLIIYSCMFLLKAIIRKISCINNEHVFIFAFYIIALLINISSFLFMKVIYNDRYFLPVSIFCVPVLGIFLTNYRKVHARTILLTILIFQIVFCTYSNIKIANSNTTNNELIEIVKLLDSNNSNTGYASFWNANVLTELSNGKIEVWNYDERKNQFDISSMYQWLQLKEHTYKHPENDIFVLLSTKQIEKFNLYYLDNTKKIYQSENYIVYLFKNYDELFSTIRFFKLTENKLYLSLLKPPVILVALFLSAHIWVLIFHVSIQPQQNNFHLIPEYRNYYRINKISMIIYFYEKIYNVLNLTTLYQIEHSSKHD